jgi:DNA invertase Pin-like site-specific DNA recombinase
MDKKSKAGIYLRISRDEENSQESTSIANQREMLRNFADARDDIEIIDDDKHPLIALTESMQDQESKGDD